MVFGKISYYKFKINKFSFTSNVFITMLFYQNYLHGNIILSTQNTSCFEILKKICVPPIKREATQES